MEQNRRRSLRKVPDDAAFIQIERDEVGRVLNISEGGLSFSSVTPVPRNLPVYFWFSFNLEERIEAMGEVAWTDISRTVGGLKFTQVSQASREQIKKWLSRLRTEQVPHEAPEIGVIGVVEEEVPEKEEAFAAQLVAAGAPSLRRGAQTNGAVQTAPVQTKTSELKVDEPEDRVAKFVSKARAHRPIPILSAEGKSALERIAAAQRIASDSKVEPEPKAAPPPVSTATAVAPQPSLGVAQSPAPERELPKRRFYRSMFSLETRTARTESSADPKAPPLSFRGIESLVELVPLQRYLSAKKRQLLCGVLLGIGLSVVVTIPILKFSNYRAHAEAKPPAADSASLKSNTSSQASLTTPSPLSQTQSQSKPTYPVAGIFSDPTPIRKGTTQSLASKSQLADLYRYRPDPAKTVPAKATNTSSGTPVQAQSSGASASGKKSGMNPTQLWGEVQAGNSKAAVELAELYIKGDGVPQNCQQARVLLLVASEKRNTAAIKRLHDLDKGASCP